MKTGSGNSLEYIGESLGLNATPATSQAMPGKFRNQTDGVDGVEFSRDALVGQ
jgi:hypothetical protein